MMDYRDSSELQLLEVARGVRKLTQMIDSWSKAPNFDTRSKYITKDLQRDSLALQESLITIRRLQETSRMMSMEQKHDIGFNKEIQVDEEYNNAEECGSQRFGVDISDDIIHRLSTNGSSRNHVNEMKSAIIGKLNKQNLVPIVNIHGIASSNLFSEFPTSRSFSLKENSKDMTDLTRKAKAQNLMGLEKIPSQVVQSVKKEQENDELKNIYKETQSCFTSHERRRSLVNGDQTQSCFTSHEQRRSLVNGDEPPTIMIMKSLQLAHENKVEKQKKTEAAELFLKKKVSDDRHRLIRQNEVNRLDKASMELFPKLRTISYIDHKQQRKEPLAICINKGRRDVQVTIPLFQTKRIIKPPAKPDKKLTTAKGGAQAVCIQSSTSTKNISITTTKTMAKHSATYLMEEDKKKGENTSGRFKSIKNANTKCKGVGKRTKYTEKASDLCSSFRVSYNHGFPQQMLYLSKLSYGENTRMGSKSFCEVMPKSSKCGKQRLPAKEAMPPYDDKPIALEVEAEAEPQKDSKLLLLTSSDFLTGAEKLFGFDVQIYRAKSYQNNNFEEFGDINAYKLLLGCAVELITRKSNQIELLNYPMCGTYQQCSKVLLSLEQLVEDVSIGIKELNGYYRTDDSKDNLYLRLERDLKCRNMFLNASWDIGWICWGACVEEIGAAVEQIGEHIMCGMVREVIFDLLH